MKLVSPEKLETLAKEFKATVSDLSDEIDPQDEHDWYSLAVGWALAKGFQPDEAVEIALHFIYDLHIA